MQRIRGLDGGSGLAAANPEGNSPEQRNLIFNTHIFFSIGCACGVKKKESSILNRQKVKIGKYVIAIRR